MDLLPRNLDKYPLQYLDWLDKGKLQLKIINIIPLIILWFLLLPFAFVKLLVWAPSTKEQSERD